VQDFKANRGIFLKKQFDVLVGRLLSKQGSNERIPSEYLDGLLILKQRKEEVHLNAFDFNYAEKEYALKDARALLMKQSKSVSSKSNKTEFRIAREECPQECCGN
jgi:hypothetical protein